MRTIEIISSSVGIMYWIDGGSRTILRSMVPSGNQTHSGQQLDINFDDMDLSPRGLAVDYVGGWADRIPLDCLHFDWLHNLLAFFSRNLYFTASPKHVNSRKKRSLAGGKILVSKLDGRYRRALFDQDVDKPSAIVTVPSMGWVTWLSIFTMCRF